MQKIQNKIYSSETLVTINTKYHESQQSTLQSSPCFVGRVDYEVLMDYIGKYSPLTTGIEDNIQIIQEISES